MRFIPETPARCPRDVDPQVAWDREHRDLSWRHGVETGHHGHVAALPLGSGCPERGDLLCCSTNSRRVRANQEHVEGLAGRGLGDQCLASTFLIWS